MTNATAAAVALVRADLEAEAALAGELARRLGGADLRDEASAALIRDLQHGLQAHAAQVRLIGEGIESRDATVLAAVAQGSEELRAARRAAWQAIGAAIEALTDILDAEQTERALDRLRLAEGLRSLARESEQASGLATRLATAEQGIRDRDASLADARSEVETTRADLATREERIAALTGQARQLEADIAAALHQVASRDAALAAARAETARLQAILGSDAHRLVEELAARLHRHPRLAAGLARMARTVRRWLVRPGR